MSKKISKEIMAELEEYLGVFIYSGTCLVTTDSGKKMVYSSCGEFMEDLKKDLNLFKKEGGEFELEEINMVDDTEEGNTYFYIIAKRGDKNTVMTVSAKSFSKYQKEKFCKHIKHIFDFEYKYAFLNNA